VRGVDDARVKYVRNGSNLGPAVSHQRALAESSAPILGILNDDDVWETDLVKRLLEPLDSVPGTVLAFGDHWVLVNGVKDEWASNECSKQWMRNTIAPGLHRPFKRLAVVDKERASCHCGVVPTLGSWRCLNSDRGRRFV
jgi:glycosyltransferase involved in cell wall biosynthesis